VTADEIRVAFPRLPPDRKVRLLALLAHNVTIEARACYPGQVGDGAAAPKLRTFNEMQHTITAKLLNLVAAGPLDFPDEGFLDTLFEKARQGDCEPDLLEAWEWSCAVQE
jgi:hypothetical protein